MSRSKVFNVQLITLIQTYPVLYDGLAAATKLQKTLAWQEIASLLHADAASLRKRWQTLCISFKRALELNKTNWTYYKYMFLPSAHAARTSNTADELEQFLDTLKPVTSGSVTNEVYKPSFNGILTHIKSEPGIDILPDDTEDDIGVFSREYSAEPSEIGISDEEATSEEPYTAIDGSQNICDSTVEESTWDDSSVELKDETNTDAMFDHLMAFKCTSRRQLNSRLIKLVKASPELYAFPLSTSRSFERGLLFKNISNQLRKFCTCPNEHITTHSVRQRWRTLCSHFRRDNFKNKSFGIPFGKWAHCEELMFLQPYLNRDSVSRYVRPVKPTCTDSAEAYTSADETIEMNDLSSLDTFFASFAEQAKRLSHDQQLQLQKRCQEAFCEIEASDTPMQVTDSTVLPPK